MTELMGNIDQVFAYLAGVSVWWGLIVLGSSAMIEYVFPPFPGDTIIIVGAVLIPKAGWPLSGVFAAVMIGTAIGTSIDWAIGRWLADTREGDTWLHRFVAREGVARRIDALQQRFERHGAIYLTVNRFVPAFRAVFFLGAGVAGLAFWKVIVFGMFSAALWNAALLAAGWAVGYKLEALVDLVATYTHYFAIVAAILLVAWLIKQFWFGGTELEDEGDDRP